MQWVQKATQRTGNRVKKKEYAETEIYLLIDIRAKAYALAYVS